MPKKKVKKHEMTGIEMVNGLTDNLAVTISPMYLPSQFAPYNPDTLVRKFGGNQGLNKYQQMKTDDAIKAALYAKKAAILSTGWKILPASDDDYDIEVAQFVTDNFKEDYIGNFETSLFDMLSAIEYGFSVTEKVYAQGEGYLFLKQLKTKPAQTFEFHTDQYGNLKEDGLRQWQTYGGIKVLPIYKFLIFTHNKENDNYYGESDLRAAYRPWWSKDNIIKFYNIYLERFGNPLIVGKFGNTASSTERTTFQSMLNNISAKTSFMLPEDASIDIIENSKGGAGEFEKAIQTYDMAIMRSVLMPNLLGFGNTSGGSYALGKQQFDVFLLILQKTRNELESLINEDLIRQLVDLNYKNIDNYPKFKLNLIDKESTEEKSRLIIEAVNKNGISLDLQTENYLRGLLGLPEIEEEAFNNRIPVISTIDEFKKEVFNCECLDCGFIKKSTKHCKDLECEKCGGEMRRKERPSDGKYAFRRPTTKREKKANLKVMEERLDMSNDGIDKMKEALRKIRDDFTTQIVRKDIIANEDIAGAKKIQFRYIRDLGLLIEGILTTGYDEGKKTAKEVVKKSELSKNYEIPSGIGLVKSKAKLAIKEKGRLLTGKISTDLQTRAKQIMIDGIQNGLPTNQVVNMIDEAFEPYVAERGMQGSVNTGGRLTTEVRTAYNQAFAVGQSEYNRPLEEEGLIEAYEFSAILDNVTTPGCEALDSNIYGINNPYLNQISPPRHWNCRSTLLPVFKGEEWQESPTLNVGRDL